MSDPMESPIFAQRRIEAKILKQVYETLIESHGPEVAKKTIADSVRKASIEQAVEMAEGVETSMLSFIELMKLWTKGGALETTVLDANKQEYNFDVTRCRYSEMYKDMGLGDIGHLLSCQRDGTFCEGYDSRIKMTRSQTIMQGAPTCTFRFKLTE